MIQKINNNLVIIYLFSLLLESICFFTIGDFQVTLTFLVSILLLMTSIINTIATKGNFIDTKKLLLFLAFIACISLNVLLTSYQKNITSLLLYFYYICLFLFSCHTLKYKTIRKALNAFMIIVGICGIYGLYQFIGNNFIKGLPLLELIPENLLTPRYNTFGVSYIGGVVYIRPHSIFLEPSHFSQFCSIIILISIISFINKKRDGNLFKKKISVFAMVSGIIGLISSLSGTGFILLGIGVLYIVLKSKSIKIKILFASFLIIAIFMIVINMNNNVIKYFTNRITEMSSSSNASSGNYRFILPLKISFETLYNGNLFGYGLGNDSIAMKLYKAEEASVGNGYFKIFIDMGVIGFIILLAIIFSFKPRKLKNDFASILFVVLLVMNAVGATFMLPSFWCYAVILNGRWINRDYKQVRSLIVIRGYDNENRCRC